MPDKRSRPTAIWALVAVLLVLGVMLGVTLLVIPRNTVDQLLIRVGLQGGTPERHIVPAGFRGWLEVRYGIAGSPELPMQDGKLVFRYPESGVLETSTTWAPGIKLKEYATYGESESTPLAREGPARRIWEEHDVAIVGEQEEDVVARTSGFFVGTREEHEDAELPLPHLMPELEPAGDAAADEP